jgi:hypothetical protein
MDVHGDKAERELPEVDPGLAAAALVVYAHRHEVVHLLYAALDEADAVHRIAQLLRIDESTVGRVLLQPLRWMLPQFRDELESLSGRSTAEQQAPPEPVGLTAD